MREAAVEGDRVRSLIVVLAVALSLSDCTSAALPATTGAGGSPPPVGASTGPTEPGVSSGGSSSALMMADADRCPVTLPRSKGPPGPARHGLFGWQSSYGNGKLWVGGLWPHGVIAAGRRFVDRHGRVRMKFGWWRDVRGRLHITGTRLDAVAPAAQADVPAGYHPTGFQASGVTFPTEGCWAVTGTVGSASLTFVTFVIKRSGSAA